MFKKRNNFFQSDENIMLTNSPEEKKGEFFFTVHAVHIYPKYLLTGKGSIILQF